MGKCSYNSTLIIKKLKQDFIGEKLVSMERMVTVGKKSLLDILMQVD